MTIEAKQNKSNRLVVPALVLIFIAPMLLSWWLLNYTEYGRGNVNASHGKLIVPPRSLEDASLQNISNISDNEQRLYGKWSLIYLHKGSCEKVCLENLYKMRQVRLASGKYATRIQRVTVLTGKKDVFMEEDQKEHFKGQLVLRTENTKQFSTLDVFALREDEDPVLEKRIYLVDPLGNLMMSYPSDAEPAGIIKDLKRLLRYSRIG